MSVVDLFGLTPIGAEVMTMLAGFLAGAGIIAFYTLYSFIVDKFFSKATRKGKRWLFAAVDTLFWIAACIVLFYIYYKVNDAALRFYSFAWMGLGFLLAYRIKRFILDRTAQKGSKQ